MFGNNGPSMSGGKFSTFEGEDGLTGGGSGDVASSASSIKRESIEDRLRRIEHNMVGLGNAIYRKEGTLSAWLARKAGFEPYPDQHQAFLAMNAEFNSLKDVVMRNQGVLSATADTANDPDTPLKQRCKAIGAVAVTMTALFFASPTVVDSANGAFSSLHPPTASQSVDPPPHGLASPPADPGHVSPITDTPVREGEAYTPVTPWHAGEPAPPGTPLHGVPKREFPTPGGGVSPTYGY